MAQLSPTTLELAYELAARQDRRRAFLDSVHLRRVVLATPSESVRLETNYLLLPQSVTLRDHAGFSPYLTHALRLTAKRAREIVAEEEEACGRGLGEAAPFFPAVAEGDSLLDPGAFPPEMTEHQTNPEFAEEFRAFVRAGLAAELAEEQAQPPPARSVGRPTLSLNFATPFGELGASVDRLGLPAHIFSRLPRQHAESVVWMAHDGARRMRQLLRSETDELRRGTFELADLAVGAPKFAELDRQAELTGPYFSDEYEQERHDRFILLLRESKEAE